MDNSLNVAHLTGATDILLNWVSFFLPRLAVAIAIVIVGVTTANWLSRKLEQFLEKTSRIDETLKPVLVSVVRYTILVLLITLALGQLGIQTTSLLAVLGAAGLAIGLALQGTLSNIAAGLMLLWLRPFRVGDFIEIAASVSLAGRVAEIGLFACKFQTFDGLFLFVPNSAVWNAPVKNHSRNDARMIVISVSLPAATNIERARQELLELAKDDNVLTNPVPVVSVEGSTGGTIMLSLSCWTYPSRIGTTTRMLIERIRESLTPLGPEFFPQQIVRTVPTDVDPARFLGADAAISSIVNRKRNSTLDPKAYQTRHAS